MYIEEKVEKLEKQVEFLTKQISTLQQGSSKNNEEFLTPAEVAKRLHRSTNTIYVRIRSGEIKATKKAGGILIPMSQFVDDTLTDIDKGQSRHKQKKERSIKEKIFG